MSMYYDSDDWEVLYAYWFHYATFSPDYIID